MEQVKEIIKKHGLFKNGSDVLYTKVLLKIEKMDIYEPIYIDMFKSYGNYQVIRLILDRLTREGKIRKIKAYPVFYEISTS